MKKVLLIIMGSVLIILIGAVIYLKMFLPHLDNTLIKISKISKTTAEVQRGQYLAMHVALCMDCHSTRDWSKFSGPMVPGTLGKGGEYFGPEMGIPGKFYSKNITPIGIGNWSDQEVFMAITCGVDKDGKALFPIMPYPHYGKINQRDVEDIIAYLRTLNPIPNRIPEDQIDFPMNFIINTMPQNPEFTEIPPRSDTLKYGGYLVQMASCIDCHSPINKGEIVPGREFAGGRVFKMPNGVVRSANITPDKTTGIGNMSAKVFIEMFKHYENPNAAYSLEQNQVNTPMPWTMLAGMDTTDLKAIYTFLQAQKPIHNRVIPFSKN